MAFLNETGLRKLWEKIKSLVKDTQDTLQGNINEKLDTSTYNAQITAGIKNPNALKVKINEETTSYDYDGSEEKNLAIKAGENITISRSGGVITIASSGELTGTIENAVKAEKDASGNVITTTYATKTEVNTLNTEVIAPISAKADANASAITSLQTITNSNATTLATKADKVTNATENHLASLDANGNLADSGIAKSTVATKTEVEAAATAAATAKSAADAAKELAEQKTTMAEVTTALNAYATKEYADTAETDAINAAKGYTDGQIALLLENPDADINSIKELSAAIAENDSAIDALNSVASSKVSKETEVIAGAGLSGGGALSSNITLVNAGVRSIATGSTNGTISVNTNGSPAEVAVAGLGTAAYKAETDFATATSVTNLSTTVDNLSASKQDKIVNSGDITIGADNKLTIVAIDVDAFFASLEGTELA